MNAFGKANSTNTVEIRVEDNGVRFGECAACFNALERPFWDSLCFDCQDGLDDLDEMDGFDG